MRNPKSLLVLCILLFITSVSYAQRIDSLLGIYNDKVPKEKIYIHFDNSVYTPGQTIWFKAYLLNGVDLSELSKNFYISWFDADGRPVGNAVAPISGACAIGSFTVPQNYHGTQLQVLAYTKWMLNFDSAFLFHRTIQIAQTSATAGQKLPVASVTTLRFFPEGGDMVENIPSFVAFKALNSAGLPMNVHGIIQNRTKQQVAAFASVHDGMGMASLTPLPGEEYTAEWTDTLGNLQHTPLPIAKHTGIVVSVNHEQIVRSFSIERPVNAEERLKRLNIVVTMNQQMLLSAVANLANKTKITTSLPINKFPSGVIQLTVFDANQQPLAERIFFVNNEEYHSDVQIRFDTVNLDKRGKNVYTIEMPDSMAGNLSLSVTEGEGVYDSSRNILSELLLSDEIKGHIHNPAYYLSSDADSVRENADLVMLTNGWRRFVWDDVKQARTPVISYQRDSGYLSLEGKIDKLSDAKIKKAEFLNLIVVAKDSSSQMIFTPLHTDGSFREDNLILFDTAKIYYQLNKTFIPARSHVNMHNDFLPFDNTRLINALPLFLSDTAGTARIKAMQEEQKRLDAFMKQATLKEVIVRSRAKTRIEEMNERYASGLFAGGYSHDFDVVNDPIGNASQSAFGYLQSRVAGLQINNPYGANPSAVWRGSRVALFLDEMQVDASLLASIPMSNIALIKVFNPPFVGASGGGGGGAIAVYTKKGDDMKTMFNGLDHTVLVGYTPTKQFYSPDYAEQKQKFSETDLRRTIYWNPYIQTKGDKREVTISFYNNDVSHSLQLVLEGLALDGSIVHVSKLLK